MVKRAGLLAALALAASAITSTAVASPATPTAKTGPITISRELTLTHHISKALNKYGLLLVTEAPDGAVFYVSGTAVYEVVHSTESLVVDVGTKLVAIAATSTRLVVETAGEVIIYARADGHRVASWPDRFHGVVQPSLATSNGVVWSLTDSATDASGAEPAVVREFAVGHQPKTITRGASPGWLAVDPAGDAYFDLFAGRIERVTPSGGKTQSTAKRFTDSPLAYANGKLLAEIDGDHGSAVVLDPRTLAVTATGRNHVGDYIGLANTTIGLLTIVSDCAGQRHCHKVAVARITLPDRRGAMLEVAAGGPVLGPKPIVVSAPAAANPKLLLLR